MDHIIATKSIKEILVHVIIVFILLTVLIMTYRYDLRVETSIEDELQLFMIVLLFLILVLLANLSYIIVLPKIIITCDGKRLNVNQRKKRYAISLDRIEVISKRVNIWAKPFLVYSDIRIETDEKTHTIRHVRDIPAVVDRIRKLMDTNRSGQRR